MKFRYAISRRQPLVSADRCADLLRSGNKSVKDVVHVPHHANSTRLLLTSGTAPSRFQTAVRVLGKLEMYPRSRSCIFTSNLHPSDSVTP